MYKAIHMWLIDFPNPYELEQSWEWTFLKQFSIGNTKWGLKLFFTDGLLRKPRLRKMASIKINKIKKRMPLLFINF